RDAGARQNVRLPRPPAGRRRRPHREFDRHEEAAPMPKLRVLLLLATIALTASTTARAQTPYLWADPDGAPGNVARGWFTTNGGNAANILVSGATTLNAALGRLAANDRIYTLAHGVSGNCVRGGPAFVGGRIRLEGADRRGFGAGTDPNNNCAAG